MCMKKPSDRLEHVIIGAITILFAIWGAVIQQLRFLMPTLPVLCMVLGLLIHAIPKAWRNARSCVLLFCLLTLALNTYIYVDCFKSLAPYKHLLGIQSEKDFLRSRLPSYPAIEYINEHLTDRDKVLFVFLRDGPYYCNCPYIYDPVFEANTLIHAIKAGKSAAGALARLRQKGITHILLNRDFLPSIEFILEPKQRVKFAGLLGMLSRQERFKHYTLCEVHPRNLNSNSEAGGISRSGPPEVDSTGRAHSVSGQRIFNLR